MLRRQPLVAVVNVVSDGDHHIRVSCSGARSVQYNHFLAPCPSSDPALGLCVRSGMLETQQQNIAAENPRVTVISPARRNSLEVAGNKNHIQTTPPAPRRHLHPQTPTMTANSSIALVMCHALFYYCSSFTNEKTQDRASLNVPNPR